jgi:hypothetical protein
VKHLRIEYTTDSGNSITLFDDDVVEVTWSDSTGTVRVEGKTQAAQGGGLNLLEMLTGGSKNKTESMVDEKRAEYEAEKAEKREQEAAAIKAKAPAKKVSAKPVVIEAEPAPVVYLEAEESATVDLDEE